MKNIKKLQSQLKNLRLQKNNLSSIDNMSLLEFIEYKHIITKENNTKKQLDKLKRIGIEINSWYNNTTNSWIENPKINCRHYCKLEKRAAYKRDKTLYNLGLNTSKPIPVIFQKPYEMIAPAYNKFKVKFNTSITNSFNSLKYFKSHTVPQKLNQMAIYATKRCISGYRMIKSDLHFYKKYISKNAPFQYLNLIKKEAIKQLDNTNSFKESLKVSIPYSNLQNSSTIHNKIKENTIDSIHIL